MMDKDKFERLLDGLKIVVMWLVVTIVAYIWWVMVLLILSLALLSVWHVLLEEILWYSGALTAVISILYAVHLFKKYKKS